MKRAVCLYRVSTKKQVGEKDDIPMQKQACRAFAKSSDLTIVKEIVEKGVSGFKVSINDREGLQEVRRLAAQKAFDVLLVFMFDRIGRREDEVPVLVKELGDSGIECWSVKEGSMKADGHVEALIIFIRFWQAQGESLKISERVSTRLAQLTAEGKYTGGVVPFGYKLMPTGEVNKKGYPTHRLVIEDGEADVVRLIFNKTVNEGYGSHMMASYINDMNIKTHNGSKFQSNTVNRILKNRIYCGYYVSKDVVSPKQEELAIIDENVFDTVQDILVQRKDRNDKKNHIAKMVKGASLLAGNVFCGHCGTRLIATRTNYKTNVINGIPVVESKRIYRCYHRTRRLNDCDGPSMYQTEKVEEAVLQIVNRYLTRIKMSPKDRALETKYEKSISDKKNDVRVLKGQVKRFQEQLASLQNEIIMVIEGNSGFSRSSLQQAILNKEAELDEAMQVLETNVQELGDTKEMYDKLDYYYEQFSSWADEFDKASLERKKMILCQMFSSITISRDYKIDAVLNATYQQFFE